MAFELPEQRIIKRLEPFCDKSFYNKIAGATHRNPDGTNRKRIIEDVAAGAWLQLIPQPDNEFDANAVAVCNLYDGQLGFLEAHTAAEVAKDLASGKREWVCHLAHHNHHPETYKVVGATFILFRSVQRYCARPSAPSTKTIVISTEAERPRVCRLSVLLHQPLNPGAPSSRRSHRR
jgi:hypothetical protein